MAKQGITARNLEVLVAVTREIDAASGKSPTLEQIGKAVGLAVSPLHGHLVRLRDAGYISWTPGAQRSIQIIRRPEPAEV